MTTVRLFGHEAPRGASQAPRQSFDVAARVTERCGKQHRGAKVHRGCLLHHERVICLSMLHNSRFTRYVCVSGCINHTNVFQPFLIKYSLSIDYLPLVLFKGRWSTRRIPVCLIVCMCVYAHLLLPVGVSNMLQQVKGSI